MEIDDDFNRLVRLVANTLNNQKVIGVRDLQMSLDKLGIRVILDEDTISELCFRLRDENIIARPHGKGIFFHIRVID